MTIGLRFDAGSSPSPALIAFFKAEVNRAAELGGSATFHHRLATIADVEMTFVFMVVEGVEGFPHIPDQPFRGLPFRVDGTFPACLPIFDLEL